MENKKEFEKKIKEVVDIIISIYPDDYITSQTIELIININKIEGINEKDLHYEISRTAYSIYSA